MCKALKALYSHNNKLWALAFFFVFASGALLWHAAATKGDGMFKHMDRKPTQGLSLRLKQPMLIIRLLRVIHGSAA